MMSGRSLRARAWARLIYCFCVELVGRLQTLWHRPDRGRRAKKLGRPDQLGPDDEGRVLTLEGTLSGTAPVLAQSSMSPELLAHWRSDEDVWLQLAGGGLRIRVEGRIGVVVGSYERFTAQTWVRQLTAGVVVIVRGLLCRRLRKDASAYREEGMRWCLRPPKAVGTVDVACLRRARFLPARRIVMSAWVRSGR